MSKKKRSRQAPRAEPPQKRGVVWMCDATKYDDLTCAGYTSLAHNPEICAAVSTIARLIGSMTIHLMRNTERGDIRITDGLSRLVDITPNRVMTRTSFVQWIVKTTLLDGRGNAVVIPRYTDGGAGGYIEELIPIPPAFVSFVPEGLMDYKVIAAGREFAAGDVLHFAENPDALYPWLGTGYQVALADVANNLKQASETERGFMSSKWKPSIIVKVDGLVDEFSGPEGRRKLLEDYVLSGEAGAPWLLPADQFAVQEVRPLTLSDLALADFVKLDKQTVATILGLPPFVLGVGDFKRDAWNSFISTRIMPLAQQIQQVLTKGLLYSPDLYFRFNARSLYNYDLQELASIADEQYIRGIMTGNEVRAWLGLPPKDGLDELVILENYLPIDRLGDQKKLLNPGGETSDKSDDADA